MGAATYATSLQLLAPRGCLINYGELSGPAPAIDLHQLFPGSVFVTKYNGMRWVEGVHEFAGLTSEALALAGFRGRMTLDAARRVETLRARSQERANGTAQKQTNRIPLGDLVVRNWLDWGFRPASPATGPRVPRQHG
jgi:NADPH:quinone reductase-like Zn-dependent oxidoreductase